METKPNVVEEAITRPMRKNKIDAIKETDKPQSSQIKKDKSIRNESNRGISLDKSRSLDKWRASQRTDS